MSLLLCPPKLLEVICQIVELEPLEAAGSNKIDDLLQVADQEIVRGSFVTAVHLGEEFFQCTFCARR